MEPLQGHSDEKKMRWEENDKPMLLCSHKLFLRFNLEEGLRTFVHRCFLIKQLKDIFVVL